MNKLLQSCMAVAAAACLLTACSSEADSQIKVENSSLVSTSDTDSLQNDTTKSSETQSSVQTSATSTTPDTQTTEQTTTRTAEQSTAQTKTTVISDNRNEYPYAAAVEEYVAVMSGNDFAAILNTMYPENLTALLFELVEDQLQDLPEFSDGAVFELVSINENETMDAEALQSAGVSFTQLYLALEYVKAHPEEETPLENYVVDENIESAYEITEGYDITITVSQDGEISDQHLLMMYIKDDGWKFMDNSLIDYITASKQSMMDSNAKSIFNAVNTALINMDSDGLNVMGNYIISSDNSLNRNLPDDFDLTEFERLLELYFGDITELEYFAVIYRGACRTVVCVASDEPEYVGSYPSNEIIQISSDIREDSDMLSLDENASYTFQALYTLCTQKLQ